MSPRDRRNVSITLILLTVAAVATMAFAFVEEAPEDLAAVETTTTTTTTTVPASAGVVTVGAGGGPVSEEPGSAPFATLAEGVVMGFDGRQGDMLRVTTTCDADAWIPADSVDIVPRAEPLTIPVQDLGDVVVVLDPGHGGPAPGVVSPAGVVEAEINLDIAERAWLLMNSPRAVDWETGEIGPGTEIPAFGSVILTRSARGPFGGDYQLGLVHRTAVANGAGAHALVSIHNNYNHNGPLPGPSSEVLYSVSSEESARLASLLHEELIRSFEQYDIDWQGSLPGVRSRFDPDTGEDYYGILRLSEVPAVITEGMYLSNPPEEELLSRAEVRQDYAEAVYRGLVRFFTTEETGTRIYEPRAFSQPGGGTPPACELPLQP